MANITPTQGSNSTILASPPPPTHYPYEHDSDSDDYLSLELPPESSPPPYIPSTPAQGTYSNIKLQQIINLWKQLYGEDLEEEYEGFYTQLVLLFNN